MSRGGLLVLLLGAGLVSADHCASFTCDSGCAKCIGKVDNGDNTQTVTISVEECKHEDVSWFCCRNAGCTLNGCQKQENMPASGIYDGEGAHNTDEGNVKCEGAISGKYTLPLGDTTLTLQVHDGGQAGNVTCPGSPRGDASTACCGGAGGRCTSPAVSGVCNYVINLSPTSGACAPPPTAPPTSTPPPTAPPTSTPPPTAQPTSTPPPTAQPVAGPAPNGPPSTPEPPFLSQPNPPPSSCPINMTVNGSGPGDFREGCGCSEFSCDSPTAPWSSRDMRFCGNCPDYLNGAYHFSCPHCADAGTEVSFGCPGDWEACDVFVELYTNCATGNTDGGLSYNLASDGWTAGSCGPSFCLPFNATCQDPGNNTAVTQVDDTHIQWKMVLFHKQFSGGEQMPIPALATDPTMYFTFFVKQGHFCSNDKNETECAAQPSVCKWDADATDPCHADICPPTPPPPPRGPCCDVAAGIGEGLCAAPETEIENLCSFNLPQC